MLKIPQVLTQSLPAIIVLTSCLAWLTLGVGVTHSADKLNVCFTLSDDLRPELGLSRHSKHRTSTSLLPFRLDLIEHTANILYATRLERRC